MVRSPMSLPSDIIGQKARSLQANVSHGIAGRAVLSTADGNLFKLDSAAHRGRRRGAGAAAGPHQHDARRIAEPVAKTDAAARAAAIRRNRHHHARGLGDGPVMISCPGRSAISAFTRVFDALWRSSCEAVRCRARAQLAGFNDVQQPGSRLCGAA